MGVPVEAEDAVQRSVTMVGHDLIPTYADGAGEVSCQFSPTVRPYSMRSQVIYLLQQAENATREQANALVMHKSHDDELSDLAEGLVTTAK